MWSVNDIREFLGGNGIDHSITGLQPLVQWDDPTAVRVFFSKGEKPESAIVKYLPCNDIGVALKKGGARWKLAQDFVNISFLSEKAEEKFVPDIIGYSMARNMLALEDLGSVALADLRRIDCIGAAPGLWESVCRSLARLICACPSNAEEFQKFADDVLPGFCILERLREHGPIEKHSAILVAEHIKYKNLSQLLEELTKIFEMVTRERSPWIGYSIGDLWHEHVIFHEGKPKFIDFDCGGYGIYMSDLVRLLEGSPMYLGEALPADLVDFCKDCFFGQLKETGGLGITREEFMLVYSFSLFSQLTSMVLNEAILHRRNKNYSVMLDAIRIVSVELKRKGRLPNAIVQFTFALEKFMLSLLERGKIAEEKNSWGVIATQ